MARWLGWSVTAVTALSGCGGEVDGAPGPAASAEAAVESCYMLCERQTSHACPPRGDEITLDACKQGCDGIVSSVKPECRAPFTEFYTCAARQSGCSSAIDQGCVPALDRFGACEGCREYSGHRVCD